jgi:hypothetical protein
VKLTTITNVSVDGYIEDEHGSFDWTEPGDDVFAFITDLLRSVGTYLYGRRMYETMAVWETDPTLAAPSELRANFATVWQAADKVVYSTILQAASTAKTRLERSFDPDSVRDRASSPTTARHRLRHRAGATARSTSGASPAATTRTGPRPTPRHCWLASPTRRRPSAATPGTCSSSTAAPASWTRSSRRPTGGPSGTLP